MARSASACSNAAKVAGEGVGSGVSTGGHSTGTGASTSGHWGGAGSGVGSAVGIFAVMVKNTMNTKDIKMNAPRAEANKSSAEMLKMLISRLRCFMAGARYLPCS